MILTELLYLLLSSQGWLWSWCNCEMDPRTHRYAHPNFQTTQLHRHSGTDYAFCSGKYQLLYTVGYVLKLKNNWWKICYDCHYNLNMNIKIFLFSRLLVCCIFAETTWNFCRTKLHGERLLFCLFLLWSVAKCGIIFVVHPSFKKLKEELLTYTVHHRYFKEF